eukprot:m.70263 g.70263  ORF g.70263 m.70263 type:complete len:194 (+) comp12121_c0_seq2:545-1126(+)
MSLLLLWDCWGKISFGIRTVLCIFIFVFIFLLHGFEKYCETKYCVFILLEGTPLTGSVWNQGVSVGDGSAVAAPLDWTVSVDKQVFHGNDPRDAEIVLALECVWLVELVTPFVNTVCSLLDAGTCRECLLCHRDRSGSESETFIPASVLTKEFADRGYEIQELQSFTPSEFCKDKCTIPSRPINLYSVHKNCT